jgi:hypothetical protein
VRGGGGRWIAVDHLRRAALGDGGSLDTFIDPHVSEEGFDANVGFVEDPALEDVSDVRAVLPPSYQGSFVFVVDRVTAADTRRPILVLDVAGTRGDPFRSTPRGVQSVSNNLSLYNMDWADFADAADRNDGVFDHL